MKNYLGLSSVSSVSSVSSGPIVTGVEEDFGVGSLCTPYSPGTEFKFNASRIYCQCGKW